MAHKIENFLRGIRQHGLNSAKNGTLTGVLAFTGANTHTGIETHTGAETHSGAEVFSGAVTGLRQPVTVGTTATYAPAATDSGMVYIATKTSATQTYTLPTAATAGLTFTFICGHADGEILVTPAASQTITMTTFAAVGADADTAIVAPSAGTGVKNTAATNAIGNSLTLVSDGITGWYTTGIATGIWASQ